ncbi:MAG: hypothetical protein R2759_07490 [Bacteroidales bacterium]
MITDTKFIKSTAIAGLATAPDPQIVVRRRSALSYRYSIGSIRDMVSNDLTGTLKILAEVATTPSKLPVMEKGSFMDEPEEFKIGGRYWS